MQKIGRKASERRAFEKALRSSHTRRITLQVTSLEGHVLANLNQRLLDGQVVVDASAEVTRSATLTLLDPHHSLNFDTDSPDDGALFADRMLRIVYEVLVEELGEHVGVTIFHGPITKLDRAGDTVDIEAQGKESLARGSIWRPTTLKKGVRKTSAIRTLLRDRAGENRLAIPDLRSRMPKTISLDRFASIWETAQRLASSMDKQLFYSGNGIATLRDLPQRPVYTFRTGSGGDIVSEVSVSYVLDGVKNTVVVKGGKPKGAKHVARGLAVANTRHPLSPSRLGRSGAPLHLVEVIEDDSIRSNKEAHAKAKRVLEDRLRSTVEVTLDSLPIPHLDPGDLIRVHTDDATFTVRLKSFSIPLGSGPMTVGYVRRVSRPNRRRIRR